ncbi:multifunctional 2',3'-cyclic-nucleotide 2'-phosphodiesterase/5'-nucleotidase/3'-nucleotidase [Deltaproteobacteria bacterium]|nr:multifunctional 2',3'-cyclic-nucleotide 2'-phosphodiesterase/5'-nucleotidase/3'-nucleotidase [Deltaproteobacteria bacterium]
MRRILSGLSFVVAGAVLTVGCPKKAALPLSPPGRLTIMHTNDLHGHYLPERADWLPGNPEIGGFVRMEQEVRAVRQARGRENTLLLDGGDILTGTPLTAIKEEGAWGTPMLRFMEAVGYDAWAVGNHEFDRGLDNLSLLSSKAPFSVLSANLRSKGGTAPLLSNQSFSRVFTVNGLRVGVIGATTDQLRTLVSPADWARMQTLRAADAVRAEVAALDPQTDVLIAVTHLGVDDDKGLAAAVPGLDLIVGGHSHTRLTEAIKQGDTWIVQTGSYGRSLGVVEMDVANDALTSFHYELRDLTPESATVEPDASLQGLAAHYQTNIDGIYGEQLGKAPVKLEKEYAHESALGRWISDALRVTTHSDIGIYNGGGLRSDIQAGVVTRRHLFECFPFENAVFTFGITGEQLVGIVLRNVAADVDGKHGFLSLGGVTWTWRMTAGAPEIVSLSVGGQPVDLTRRYTAAATSYITEQWQKHLGFEPMDAQLTGANDFEAAVEYAKVRGLVDDGQRRGVRVD